MAIQISVSIIINCVLGVWQLHSGNHRKQLLDMIYYVVGSIGGQAISYIQDVHPNVAVHY